jgi:serine protease AprX
MGLQTPQPRRLSTSRERARTVTAMRRPFAVLLFAAASIAALPAPTQGQLLGGLLDEPLPNLLSALPLGTTRVIVRVERGALSAVVRLVTTLGGRIVGQHRLIDGLTIELPVAQVALLVRVPGVLSVSADAPVSSTLPVDVGPAESHLVATLALPESGLLRSTVDGRGVAVGVIDSGLSATGAYQIRRFVDFTRPANGRTYAEYAQPTDDYGHGTHVGGLIAGNGAGSNGRYRGVAPGAVLVGLKVLDASGAGRTSDVLTAIEYAVVNREALGLRVLNLSLGHPIFEPAERDPLVQAVEAAVRSGLVVVVSAGNFGCLPQTTRCGYAGITSPGNAPSAITVGALDTRNTTSRLDDGIATYSSRGPSWYDGYAKPDVVAPGHRLVSTVSPGSTLGRDRTRQQIWASPYLAYSRLSGTSMATAVTAGTVALVLDANERSHTSSVRLTPNTVKALLEFTSFDVTGADALTQGAGALNAAGAIELGRRIDPAAAPGTQWVASVPYPSTRIGSDQLPWTQRFVWGDRYAFGDSVYANRPAWAQAIVWGDECAGTPFVTSTHDGADTVTRRTGSPIAVVATELPSRSAVQPAAVSPPLRPADATLNSPSGGGTTRCSLGFISCGIQPYGMRYARYTAFDGFGPAPANIGNMYSQTIAPSLVTSKSRPPAPAVTRVLPFASRCALLMLVLKNLGFVYDQTSSSVTGLISSTRDVARAKAPTPSGAIGVLKP